MTDVDARATGHAARPAASYLDEGHTLWSWLPTTDHKRIAILYAIVDHPLLLHRRRRRRR